MSDKELKRNVKVYPWYRAFDYDMLFLWTISILFLTNVKGLSYSQVILLDSIFMLSAFLLQVPISKIIQKIGRVRSAQISALTMLGFILIYIFGNSFPIFVLANVIYGIGASFRNVSDAEILSLTLKKLRKSNEFGKIEGKALFIYYITEAITAIFAGYMYEYISPYSPLIGTAIFTVIVLCLSFVLKEPVEEEDVERLENQKEREPSYKTLLKRPFVIWMMVFCFCLYGLLSMHSSLSKMYLQNIEVPAYLYGYIFCVFKLLAGFASKFEFKYELKRGVRSLITFSLVAVLSFTTCGVVYLINPTAWVSIILLIIVFATQNISRAGYRIAVKNYINACVSKNSLNKVLSLYSMAECLGYAVSNLLCSALLELSGNSYVITNLGLVAIFGIPLIVSTIFYIRALIKAYTVRCTTIRPDCRK